MCIAFKLVHISSTTIVQMILFCLLHPPVLAVTAPISSDLLEHFFKISNFANIPEKASCTSLPQAWSLPVERCFKTDPVPIHHVVPAEPMQNRHAGLPLSCHIDLEIKRKLHRNEVESTYNTLIIWDSLNNFYGQKLVNEG